jgi:hypothetical protein
VASNLDLDRDYLVHLGDNEGPGAGHRRPGLQAKTAHGQLHIEPSEVQRSRVLRLGKTQGSCSPCHPGTPGSALASI